MCLINHKVCFITPLGYNINMKCFSCILFILSLSTSYVHAEDRGNSQTWTQRIEKRSTTRWTLQEWMAQKEKNQLQDMWLAMNSSSPYEFAIQLGSYSTSTQTGGVEDSFNSTRGNLSAYAQMIGLDGAYEHDTHNGVSDSQGMLNIRVLGNSIQSTSLTLHYGQRNRYWSDDSHLQQQFGQVSLQLYFTRHAGLQGFYRSYQPAENSTLGEVKAYHSQAGIFIDFKAVRIFGDWFYEKETRTLNSVETPWTSTGILSGLKIFF